MRRDMESPEIMDLLQTNHDEAAAAKIDGTPGFAINGKFYYGYNPEALDKGLKDAAAAPA
jgi:2-hydroxychromene-2-carboxylate isomerase